MRHWLAALMLALPCAAQAQHQGHGGHEQAAPTSQPDPHEGHGQPAPAPASPPAPQPDPHAGHRAPPGPALPPPPPPADHAADALFDPAEMARARALLARENGGFTGSMILLDRLEVTPGRGDGSYGWEAEAWFGGDLDRLLLKSEGEGALDGATERAEIQALYSRAITPFWNLHAGLRHDIRPAPSRTHAVIGIEGLAPYWLHVTGQVFLSDQGEVQARIEASHDVRIAQRLILQPRGELELSAQDMPELGIGAGVPSVELGLRLRYEIRREFAPYVGVQWERLTGDTARYSRQSGDDPDRVSFVAGIRAWF